MIIVKTFRSMLPRSSSESSYRWTRLFAGKTPNRAAVHGLKQSPEHHVLNDRERIEAEVEKTKEEQGKRRKEVKEKVETHLKKSEEVVPESPESLSTS